MATVVLGSVVLVGCADGVEVSSTPAGATEQEERGAIDEALDPCSRPNMTTVEPGALTFATSDTPAPPYFLTEVPADRRGLESDLAYELADRMGFRPQEVTWEFVSPDEVVTGQFVDYDIAIAGFAPRSEEFPAVEYTRPYLEVGYEVVSTAEDVPAVLTGTRPADDDADQARAPGDLAWGASFQGSGPPWLIGEGWMEYETRYDWVRGGVSLEAALEFTDAIVIDEHTRRWLQEIQDIDTTTVGGVPVPEGSYAMVMVAGNPLLGCVDRALGEMSEAGELSELGDRWLEPRSWIEN